MVSKRHLRGVCIFFREDSEAEVPVLVGFKGGGHDNVFSCRELEPVQHLSQVDEGVGFFPGFVGQEEVFAQMNICLARKLRKSKERGKNHAAVCTCSCLQIKNIIGVSVSYVWGKENKKDVSLTELKKKGKGVRRLRCGCKCILQVIAINHSGHAFVLQMMMGG